MPTDVAPPAGLNAVIVGAVLSCTLPTAVVNDDTVFWAIGLPAKSRIPAEPPRAKIAEFIALASAEVGVSVAILVAALYANVAGTALPLPSINLTVLAFTVETSRSSLKLIVTVGLTGTLLVPSNGVKFVIVGATVSPAAEFANNTSTK